MITISKQQAFQRWDSLSDKLREALASEDNGNFLWRICETEHLPKEKIKEVSLAAGYIIMGFMHPGDLAHELQEENIISNKQVAESIAGAINDRIFAPIRVEIDGAYEPPSRIKPTLEFPKIVEEIKAPSAGTFRPSPAQPVEVKPIDISKIFGATKPFDSTQGKPAAGTEIKLPAIPTQPTLTRSTPVQPPPTRPLYYGTAPTQGKTPQAQASTVPTPPSTSSRPSLEATAGTAGDKKTGVASEFARLGFGEGSRVKGQGSESAAPKILYKEAEIKPGPSAGFRIGPPTPKLSETKLPTPPPTPAKIEFPSFGKASADASARGGSAFGGKAMADKSESRPDGKITPPSPAIAPQSGAKAGPPQAHSRAPLAFGQKPETEFRPPQKPGTTPPNKPLDVARSKSPFLKIPATPPDFTAKPTKPISSLGPKVVNYAELRTPVAPVPPKPALPASSPPKAAEGMAPIGKPEIKIPLLGDEKRMHPDSRVGEAFGAEKRSPPHYGASPSGITAPPAVGPSASSRPSLEASAGTAGDKSAPPRPRIEPPPIRKPEAPPPLKQP